MTDTVSKPTLASLLAVWREGDDDEEHICLIEDVVDGSWRHGSTHRAVFLDGDSGTYWAVDYRTNPSGDYNDFRDGDLDESAVIQVVPHEKTIRTWKPA